MKIEIDFQEILLPIDKWYSKFIRPGRKLKEVRGVVIHWVENPMLSRPSQIAWWWRVMNLKKYNPNPGNRFASAHINIGKKGEIGMTIPLDEVAFHSGGKKYQKGIIKKIGGHPNNYLIGIECCHTNWKGDMTTATWMTLYNLIEILMKEFKFKKDMIFIHHDITGKKCHRYFLKKKNGKWIKDQKKWDNFLANILKND